MKVQAHVTKVDIESMPGVKAFADITVENCCQFNGIQVRENKDGELFVSYPQKAVKDENGQPKFRENGKPMYTDVFYANSKEANDAIKALVLEAYGNENGRAYINPQKGEFVSARIEPNLHACNTERTKASGSLEIGGYMRVHDIFVNLAENKEGEKFLAVSYPHYKSGEDFKDYVVPLEKGKVWDRDEKVEKDYDFKHMVEGVMKKQTIEFHPELVDVLKANKSVDEKIADAKAEADGANGKQGKEPDLEPSK